ncbi:MAG TPA: 2-succinyl-5-enolpyruvyl-6-hydroxy-3-cyclohexene-1-carboxylate synthase, partial [Flavobacteriales bacterium]|nr:2-succinyl-5-enolpyruvyl-6-hydroxy-3-cyclohexene-1-carboxylate synthase [Flavobacteriales bacterium]
KYLKGNFKIILVNNKGGNIFRIIDGPSENTVTETFFEAKQDLHAKYLCKQFGVNYAKATDEKELAEALPGFLKTGERPGVLEVFTDNIVSPKTLKEYFEYLKLQTSNVKP